MTTTDIGRRSPEQLLTQARELIHAAPNLSKTGLQKALSVGWSTATEVHATVSRERQEAAAHRHRQARATLRQLPGRKRPGRTPAVMLSPFRIPSAPVADDVVPAPVEPGAEPSPEVVEKTTAPTLTPPSQAPQKRPVTWPVLVIASGAFVAIWAGWVALGKLTGFGKVNVLPGLGDLHVDIAITLPVGMEAYAAYAFYVWLHPRAPRRAQRFAMWSSLGATLLGFGGQIAYHQMSAAKVSVAPWWITAIVSCLPVGVFAISAVLAHLVRAGDHTQEA